MDTAAHDEICRQLADQGRLIEAGFRAMAFLAIPANAPAFQVEDMRMAFFAGAQHLFASIMGMLEPGAEATDADLNRLTIIQIELDAWVEQIKAARAGQP
jgi:hypothetical protein